VLGIEALCLLLSGLVLLACGSGLLKPNVSTLVGNLYSRSPGAARPGLQHLLHGRDIGAFISPLERGVAAAPLRLERRVHVGAVAMLFSLITFVRSTPLAAADVKVNAADAGSRALPPSEVRSRVITLIAISASRSSSGSRSTRSSTRSRSGRATARPRPGRRRRSRRFEPLGVILLSPVLVAVWAWLQRRNGEPSTPVKMLMGVVLVATAFGALAYAGRSAATPVASPRSGSFPPTSSSPSGRSR